MRILSAGTRVFDRNIVFENIGNKNKKRRCDTRKGHIVVVLLPTSEKQETAVALISTTSKFLREKYTNVFFECKCKPEKGNFIGKNQIIEIRNSADERMSIPISKKDFFNLLCEFYNHQTSLEPQNEEFKKIKSKIEILIELLKANPNNIDISREDLDILDTLKNTKKAKLMYRNKTSNFRI